MLCKITISVLFVSKNTQIKIVSVLNELFFGPSRRLLLLNRLFANLLQQRPSLFDSFLCQLPLTPLSHAYLDPCFPHFVPSAQQRFDHLLVVVLLHAVHVRHLRTLRLHHRHRHRRSSVASLHRRPRTGHHPGHRLERTRHHALHGAWHHPGHWLHRLHRLHRTRIYRLHRTLH